MGGDLPLRIDNLVPTFLLRALRDPDGANLDRVQIVKGWIDVGGQTHERVYDVVWSDIGAPELTAAWSDPDFEASVSAFYYARVIEVATPRWTAYDAEHFELTLPDEAGLLAQERAYSSPIWYTPAKKD